LKPFVTEVAPFVAKTFLLFPFSLTTELERKRKKERKKEREREEDEKIEIM